MDILERTNTVTRLGLTVKTERKRQGLTQIQLARKAHVSRSFLTELEAGHRRAELGKVMDVLEGLGLHPFEDLSAESDAEARSHRTDSDEMAEAHEGIAFADAALAVAGHELKDGELREIATRAALGELTAEEALAAARTRIQG